MVAKIVTGRSAGVLATFVDDTLADRSTEGGSTLAIAGVKDRSPTAYELVSLGTDLVQALGSVPTVSCAAVCLSAVGTAVRLDLPSRAPLPVRATVAVTCCDTKTLLRHRGGVVQRSVRSGGALVEMLRAWADLRPCEGCSRIVGANSAKESTQGW